MRSNGYHHRHRRQQVVDDDGNEIENNHQPSSSSSSVHAYCTTPRRRQPDKHLNCDSIGNSNALWESTDYEKNIANIKNINKLIPIAGNSSSISPLPLPSLSSSTLATATATVETMNNSMNNQIDRESNDQSSMDKIIGGYCTVRSVKKNKRNSLIKSNETNEFNLHDAVETTITGNNGCDQERAIATMAPSSDDVAAIDAFCTLRNHNKKKINKINDKEFPYKRLPECLSMENILTSPPSNFQYQAIDDNKSNQSTDDDNDDGDAKFLRVGVYCTMRSVRDKLKSMKKPLCSYCTLNTKRRPTKRSQISDAFRPSPQSDQVRTIEDNVDEILENTDLNFYCDADDVEDYLMELDAYLDEAEKECQCRDLLQQQQSLNVETSESIVDFFNEFDTINSDLNDASTSNLNDDNEVSVNFNLPSSSTLTVTEAAAVLPSYKNDNTSSIINGFCTLPKQRSVNRLNQELSNDDHHYNFIDDRSIYDNEDVDVRFVQVTRGHPFRNTIASDRNTTATVCGNSDNQIRRFGTGTTDTSDVPHRRSLWLRNSMRKTRPILLPDHPINTIITSSTTTTGLPSSSEASNYSETVFSFNPPTGVAFVPESPPCDEQIHHQSIIMSNSNGNNEELDDFASFNNIRFSGINNSSNISDHQEVTSLSPVRPAPLPPTTDGSLGSHSIDTFPALVDQQLMQNAIMESSSPQSSSPIRQMGRRSEMRPRLIAINAESSSTGTQRITLCHQSQRPNSAPARVSNRSQSQRYTVGSEPSSVGSSRNPSPVSLISSSASSSSASAAESNDRPHHRSELDPDESPDETEENLHKISWPHTFSRALATICCTLGLFNISRFAIFSIHFGANFIVQFLLLSFVFGIPMLWLQMCLGAKLKGGPVTMWRISPISKGIGIALIFVQGLIGLYAAVSIGWILVFFRDSFVSRNEKYRWQIPFELYRGPGNDSWKLSETIPDYFNGVVLQRLQLGPAGRVGNNGLGVVRFQLAFNLAIFWTAVFIVLCKGLRSYGKIVIGLIVLPIIGLTALCTKLLSMIDFSSVQNIFPATDWQDFFMNSQSWMSAAQETFLTWGLLGASVISMSCRNILNSTNKKELRRDALVIVVVTIYGLILAAIIGNACVQILHDSGYYYFPGSFENIVSNVFIYPLNAPLPPQIVSIPSKWLPRYSTLLGESFRRPGAIAARESGYQVIRLVTELFPATLAAATQEKISPVWSLFGFLTLLLFGLGQLCAIWKPIVGTLGDSPSSVLLSCVSGLLLAIPLATESGISIVHFLDVILGGAWWIMLLWIAQIIAVFLIRGRPYSGDILVNDLHLTQTLSAFLAFSWNVLIPIGLMILCIFEYKESNAKEFFHWRGTTYWPLWARKVGGFLQIALLQVIPLTALIQIYRYLSKGPPDILDRIQLLYRPDVTSTNLRQLPRRRDTPTMLSSAAVTTITLDNQTTNDDAPPKYTPPPSYTTATGARIAKMLRQSIRRSVRRILGEPSRQRPVLQQQHSTTTITSHAPPDYSTAVLADPSGGIRNSIQLSVATTNTINEIGPRALYNSHTNRNMSIDRRHFRNNTLPQDINTQRLTAQDVAQLLRPRRSNFHRASSLGACVDQVIRSSFRIGSGSGSGGIHGGHSRSVENLVLNAAPLGQSSIITLDRDDDSTSVI